MSKTSLKLAKTSIFESVNKYEGKISYEKRHGMASRLMTSVKDLHGLGYELKGINNIKQKHVAALVNHWKDKSLSVGTIKNRLSDLRFICEDAGRKNVVKNNSDYDIGSRTYVGTDNKAINNANFTKVKDEHLKLSLELQREFGLRREECLKVIPSMADKGDYLWLKGSWTKGKVERKVPIRTLTQRQALDKAKAFVGQGKSLIPEKKTYIQQRHVYNRETHQLGYRKLHGLRHAYAQRRYKEITGWRSPINGGKSRKSLTMKERKIDRAARYIIANELGHSRISITKVYLGA